VDDGSTGFLCEPRNADDFAAKAELLARDAGLRARMGAAARKKAEEYEWHRVLEEMMANYQRVVGS
jgi:glycosyltransferase involved in cell wall biosynthesis